MKKNTKHVGCVLTMVVGLIGFLGCGPLQYVPMNHVIVPADSRAESFRALRQVYLVLHKPGVTTSDLANQAYQTGIDPTHVERHYFDVDEDIFSHLFNNSLEVRGGRVAAYRVASNTHADPYLEAIQPSGILDVEFQSITINLMQVLNPSSLVATANPQPKYKKWLYSGQINLKVQLLSFPEKKLLANNIFSSTFQREFKGDPSDANENVVHNQLLRIAALKLAETISPATPVVHYRPLVKSKTNPDGLDPIGLVEKNKWAKAEIIWAVRVSSGSAQWQDKLGLAVVLEHQKNYEEAKKYYQEAEQDSANDPAAKAIEWKLIYADLDLSVSDLSGSLTAGRAWFGHRIAVLPFSFEGANQEGSELIRILAFRNLKNGGYKVVPLGEIDKRIKDKGFSDANTLAGQKTEAIASWLGADWLLMGHLQDFNEVTIGIYRKRSIAGRLSLWDVKTQQEIWSSEQPVNDEMVGSQIKTPGKLARPLKVKVNDRLAKNPLTAQMRKFVDMNLEDVPMRPAE